MTRSFYCTLSTFAAMLIAGGWVFATLDAQEAEPADTAAAADNEESAEEREYRQLPRYYAQVVAPFQREKIYTIQSKYEEQVKVLQEQIRAILAKRDAEIDQVLFAEQREILKQLRAEAEARSRAAAKLRADEEATDAATAPKKTASGN